jgi:hypothetical protein
MANQPSYMAAIVRYARQTVLLFITCLLLPAVVATGQSVYGPEYDVKLGFIYNFVNFVTWPSEVLEKNTGVLVFCFASDDPSSEALFKLNDKSIRGLTIKVERYKDDTSIEKCQIFFFDTRDKDFIRKKLDIAKGRSILTIGEIDDFAKMGGVINFFIESNRLRFQVNIDAAQREGLKLSAQLLQSAEIVREEPK